MSLTTILTKNVPDMIKGLDPLDHLVYAASELPESQIPHGTAQLLWGCYWVQQNRESRPIAYFALLQLNNIDSYTYSSKSPQK